jgi:hypothetical protein
MNPRPCPAPLNSHIFQTTNPTTAHPRYGVRAAKTGANR